LAADGEGAADLQAADVRTGAGGLEDDGGVVRRVEEIIGAGVVSR